jgi:hypothetical protein
VIGEQTNGRGIDVTGVEVRDPERPPSMQRAMARPAARDGGPAVEGYQRGGGPRRGEFDP